MNSVHASALLVGERGVLIRGGPGSGKSSLLLALLSAAPETTWLVADDHVILLAANGRLLASAPEALAGLMEIRGQGIVRQRHIAPARIHLVVDLLPPDACPRLPAADTERINVEGVDLPRLILPVGAGDGALRVSAALARTIG